MQIEEFSTCKMHKPAQQDSEDFSSKLEKLDIGNLAFPTPT